MKFSKGKIVVHPHHGPATVERVFSHTLRGKRKQYITLLTHEGELSVSVPVERAKEIGVRPPMDVDGVKEIFAIFLDESGTFDRVWSRRFKDYNERLKSGNVETLAGLIRDIMRRNEERKVSYGELGVMRSAVSLMVAELALSLKITAEEASTMMDQAILEEVEPKLDKDGLVLAS